MACGDVLSLEDLQTAKKHQVFEAEVITGKAGGVAGGATIGTATNPVTGQTQQTLPSILADLGFDVQSWTSSTGGVLSSANQVFLNDTSGSLGLGDYYAWGGPFPKTIPAGTDPALPAGGYIMRSSRFAGTQAREALRRSYAEAGYNLVPGSFEAGGTLVNTNDVLLQERTGKAFSGPAGAVAAGTNPASGGFVDISVELSRFSLKAAGVSATNTAAENTAIIQNLINRAAGKTTYPSTISDLRSAQFLGPILWDVTGFDLHPLYVYANTVIDGVGVSFYGNQQSPARVLPLPNENRGAFIFEPRDMADWVADPSGNGPYATGGTIKNIYMTCVGGIFAVKHFSLHYNHIMDGCVFTGDFDFLSRHDDGWAHWFNRIISITRCGAFWANRVTLDCAENCYCNQSGDTSGAIFDFKINNYIDSLTNSFSGHSSQRNTRALHLNSSVMNLSSCIFEHWDLGRVQHRGQVGKDTSYYEDIGKYLYALAEAYGDGLAPTSLISVEEVVDNLNVSPGGNDVKIDLTSMSPLWSSVKGLGVNRYSTKGATIKMDAAYLRQKGLSKKFVDLYSNPVKVDTTDVTIYVASTGDNNNDGLSSSRPVADIYTAISAAASFTANPLCSVNIILLNSVVFSVDAKTSVNSRTQSLSISSGTSGSRVTMNMSGNASNTCLIICNDIKLTDVDILANNGSLRNVIFDPNTSTDKINVKITNSTMTLNGGALFGDRSSRIWELSLSLTNVTGDVSSNIFRQTSAPSGKIITIYAKKSSSILGNESGNIPVMVASAVS